MKHTHKRGKNEHLRNTKIQEVQKSGCEAAVIRPVGRSGN